jgi:hypothetical protein
MKKCIQMRKCDNSSMIIRTILSLFILFTLPIFAEYGGFYLSIKIIDKNERTTKGFVYLQSEIVNLQENTNHFLENALKVRREKLYFNFYSNLIEYFYKENLDPKEKKAYLLINPSKILKTEIKNIEIESSIYHPYSISILNQLKLEDINWISKEPISALSLSSENCSYSIFIHKNSNKLKKIIKNINSTNNFFYNEKEIKDILDNFDNEKIVIISECSC